MKSLSNSEDANVNTSWLEDARHTIMQSKQQRKALSNAEHAQKQQQTNTKYN
jgi:hypothetical protein